MSTLKAMRMPRLLRSNAQEWRLTVDASELTTLSLSAPIHLLLGYTWASPPTAVLLREDGEEAAVGVVAEAEAAEEGSLQFQSLLKDFSFRVCACQHLGPHVMEMLFKFEFHLLNQERQSGKL